MPPFDAVETLPWGMTTRALLAKQLDTFTPAPTVPESFRSGLRQFGEKFGYELRLDWQPWFGYWTIFNKERIWDEDAEGYRIKERVLFDCLTPMGEPMPLDNRIFDEMARLFMGDSKGEKQKYQNRLVEMAERQAKKDKEALEEKIAVEAEPYIREIYDHETGSPAAFYFRDRRSQ